MIKYFILFTSILLLSSCTSPNKKHWDNHFNEASKDEAFVTLKIDRNHRPDGVLYNVILNRSLVKYSSKSDEILVKPGVYNVDLIVGYSKQQNKDQLIKSSESKWRGMRFKAGDSWILYCNDQKLEKEK